MHALRKHRSSATEIGHVSRKTSQGSNLRACMPTPCHAVSPFGYILTLRLTSSNSQTHQLTLLDSPAHTLKLTSSHDAGIAKIICAFSQDSTRESTFQAEFMCSWMQTSPERYHGLIICSDAARGRKQRRHRHLGSSLRHQSWSIREGPRQYI